MKYAKILFVILTVALVVGGHVGLWLSDAYTVQIKTKLTLLNAIGWIAILLPAIAVSKWAKSHAPDDDAQD